MNQENSPANCLRSDMKKAGINVEELAKISKIGEDTIQKLLGGISDIDLSIASKLSNALGRTPQEWLKIQEEWNKADSIRRRKIVEKLRKKGIKL